MIKKSDIIPKRNFIRVNNIDLLLANIFSFLDNLYKTDPISAIHPLTCDKPTSCDHSLIGGSGNREILVEYSCILVLYVCEQVRATDCE